jgi:FkbM family methyltransferase
MYGNPLDWNEMSVWRRVLGPGSLFVDIGANVGIYTIWAADVGAEVVAIEPNRESRERLMANLELNGYTAEIVPAAIGESEGTVRLTTHLDNQNHLLLSVAQPACPSEPVPVRTLDSLLGERVIDGLKVDVEGAELLVLKGARQLLSQHRVHLIQLEWNQKSARLLGEDRTSTAALLESHGYELLRPDTLGNLVPLADLNFGSDVFARPRDRMRRPTSA